VNKLKAFKFYPALLITAVLGFLLKYYNGAGSNFINNSLAGAAYVTFWCIYFRILLPRTSAKVITIAVTLTTCFLEFLQLWHPPFLIYLRQFWLTKILLGTTFHETDFIWYLAGAIIGWIIIRKSSPTKLLT